MKITKLQIECLKQLESRDLIKIDRHNWKFELLHLFVKDKTVMALAGMSILK